MSKTKTDYLLALHAAWRAHDALSAASPENYGGRYTTYVDACKRMTEAYGKAVEADATSPARGRP